jgi:cytochrome P450
VFHLTIVGSRRQAVKDYTFSDGTVIPKGAILSTPTNAIHKDVEIYEDANEFKGFRFSDLREKEGENAKFLSSNTSTEFLHFGHGIHAW